MKLFDRALRSIGLARHSAAPKQRTFAGARLDRLTEDFFSGTTSGFGDLYKDLRRLRNRSRTMVRDSAVAKRYVRLFPENVVGESGILLKPAALKRDDTADVALNDRIKAAWEEWSEPTHCTTDGLLGWTDVQRAVARLEPMDGEALIRIVPRGRFGLQLQLLDPDQLDDTLNIEPGNGRPWIRQGVELDEMGRPIFYHIWDGHPNDQRKGQRRRVPADDIILLFDPFRPGAQRGIPWLHAALLSTNMLEGLFEATLTSARIGAATMGAVSGLEEDDEDTAESIPLEATPGRFIRIGKEQKIEMFDPKQPSAGFGEFAKAIIRSIAQAGGVSYTSLSGDLEAVNYGSIRAGLLSERDEYRWQQQRLIRYLCRRVYTRWLQMAPLTGALPLTADEARRAQRHRWQARGFPWIDPLKDIEALRAEVALGLNSRTAAAAERGRDFELVIEQIDDELRLAKEYGVDVTGADLPAPVIVEDGVTEVTVTTKPGEAAKPAAAASAGGDAQQVQTTEDAVLNGAQISSAKDIVLAVAKGELPRDAGVAMLQLFFNLAPDKAEAVMGSAGQGTTTTPNQIEGGGEPPVPKPEETADVGN